MKILFASDSLKGTLSAHDTIRLLTEAAQEVLPACETIGIPIADGGEGTLEAVITAKAGTYHSVRVKDPMGSEISASYGGIEHTAVIEMARASGLPLIAEEKRNPMLAATYGTGQLIADALNRGYRKIYIAIGGSATNDGGMGALAALGVRFLDVQGKSLAGRGKDLAKVAAIDCTRLHEAVRETEFYVMCDVKNPLVGEFGATKVFGPQKGATASMLSELEAGMINYAAQIYDKTQIAVAEQPGAGAAGGLGAALHAFLNAKMISGIDAVLDIIAYDDIIKDVDLVVTGEGSFDRQSLYGKAIYGISMRNKRRNIPTVVLAGGIRASTKEADDAFVTSSMSTICYPMDISEACANAENLYKEAAKRMFRFIRLGMEISHSPNPLI